MECLQCTCADRSYRVIQTQFSGTLCSLHLQAARHQLRSCCCLNVNVIFKLRQAATRDRRQIQTPLGVIFTVTHPRKHAQPGCCVRRSLAAFERPEAVLKGAVIHMRQGLVSSARRHPLHRQPQACCKLLKLCHLLAATLRTCRAALETMR